MLKFYSLHCRFVQECHILFEEKISKNMMNICVSFFGHVRAKDKRVDFSVAIVMLSETPHLYLVVSLGGI